MEDGDDKGLSDLRGQVYEALSSFEAQAGVRFGFGAFVGVDC